MTTATFRNNETGELLQLDESWLDRFPKDPYTRVSTDELAKLQAEQLQADIDALDAKPYASPEDTPDGVVDAPSAPSRASADAGDTPPATPNQRDERRF